MWCFMDEPYSQDDTTSQKPLDKSQQAIRDSLLPPKPCGTCGKTVVFADRPNGKIIPLDARAQVYFVTRRNGRPFAETLTEFRQRLVNFTLRDDAGNPVVYTPDRLIAFLVTHFATCRDASQHSRKNKSEFPRR